MERLTETPNPIPSFRALLAADAVRVCYYQNTRATTARLAGELHSEYDTRAVHPYRFSKPLFRLECQIAAGAVLAGRPRDA